MDARDHNRCEAELGLARAARDAILQSSMDAILIMHADGTIEETNAAAERMFERKRAEMIGREMAEVIIPASLREAHRSGLGRYLETGESRMLGRRLELTAIRADGGEFPVELTVARLDDLGTPRFIGYVRDVSEQHRAQQAPLERARLASLSADVGLALTRPTGLDETLQSCAQAVVDHLGAAFARVWTLNKEENVLELRASAGLYTHLDGLHARMPVGTLKIGMIAQTKRPHLTNQVIGDPGVSDQAWAEREGMVAFAGYPLLIEDELEGVLAMFARRELSESDFEALEIVARGLALGIARIRVVAAMRDNQSRYEFLADSIPTHVWTARPDGRLDYFNQRAVQYFGRPADEIASEHWSRLMHADDREKCVQRWTRSLSTGEAFEAEYRLLDKAGAYQWHLGRAAAFRAGRRIVRWFGTSTLIQEAKETQRALEQRAQELSVLAQELARAATALENSNRELDQFAYVASHDLKAPLRGIANLAQWIEEDLGPALSPTSRGYMELLQGRVHRMEALIDGILEYSRAGRSTVAPERVDTGALVNDVIELLTPPTGATIDVEPDLPVVSAERLLLLQVFLNLIGNAVKHNTRPQPLVRVGWRPLTGGVMFHVQDNGPGIAPAYHQRIWGIFQTLEARDKVEGTGIGLALVKKIVESRGGRVWVESEEGAGAVFKFIWPTTGSL